MTEATPLASEQITRLREALKPFADLAEHDTSESDHDLDIWRPSGFTKCPNINVGHLRAALAALSTSPAPSGQGVSGEVDAEVARIMALSDEEVLAEANVGDVAWARGFKQGLQMGRNATLAAPAPSCAPGEVERLRDQLANEAKDWRHNAYTRVMLSQMHDRLAALSPQGLDAKEGGE